MNNVNTCVIFAGGLGTRLGKLTQSIPKPMVTIGDKPIIWHIMKHYSLYGVDNFVILAGYKQDVIKQYFSNYYLNCSNIQVNLQNSTTKILNNDEKEKWTITIVDTGLNTLTALRLKKAKEFIHDDCFFLTYGDGLSDVNIDKLLSFHYNKNKICTMTAIQPTPRFGILHFGKDEVIDKFDEKTKTDDNWVNGGFFVCNKEIFDFITDDENISFENGPISLLSKKRQLVGYKHYGKWQCMDTEREHDLLENMYINGNAFWL